MGKSDERYMRRALELAERKGRYVSPNPKVGAVLVKGGRIVGEGAHSRFGGPHAEVVALRQAGRNARGATLYVNLEPCSHQGKRGPCCLAVATAGVREVVASLQDPYPPVSGRGFRFLRRSGVKVKVGTLKTEAERLNKTFLRNVRSPRPWVILKAAMGWEGGMAFPGGKPRWITGKKARRKVHEARSNSDAVLVGSGTALQDDPSLTVRLPGWTRKDGWPLRVLLDGDLRVGPSARIFRDHPRTLVFCSKSASRLKEKALSRSGAWVFRVAREGKMLSLKAVLKVLHSLGVGTLLVEGGAKVHEGFLREGLADEALFFVARRKVGWRGPRLDLGGILPRFKDLKMEKLGEDFLLSGYLKI